MEISERIMDMDLKGYCCSQIITGLILEDLNKENNDLIAAMGGYCNGLETGETCGTLLAAVAMLYMVDPKGADKEYRAELLDWFYDSYGSYKCSDIVHDDPAKKMEVCPVMIENCYALIYEMLEDHLEG